MTLPSACFRGSGTSPAGPGSGGEAGGWGRLSKGHVGLPEDGSRDERGKGPESAPSVPAERTAPGL